MECSDCFVAVVAVCNETITVKLDLLANTVYKYMITDKFGTVYTKSITTDGSGDFEIDVDDFPEGFFNEYSGSFTLQIYTSTDALQEFIINEITYDCIVFSFIAGDGAAIIPDPLQNVDPAPPPPAGAITCSDLAACATIIAIEAAIAALGTPFITSKANTATIALTVAGGQLTADFISLNISQFTNNAGYLTTPVGASLLEGKIWLGSAGNVAAAVTPSGQATISNGGVITLDNAAVIGKVLTGYVSGAGVVAATDTILQAIQKLNGNIAAIPSFTPSALTKTDDTNITLTLGGTPATALLQATSLTLGWTGTLADGRIASAATWNAKLTSVLTSAHIFVGSAGNVATDVAMSGDATLANTGALTIANGVVTYAKFQNVTTNRLLGRATAGVGSAEEITLGTNLSFTGTTLNAASGLTNPMTTLGDIIYEDVSPAPVRLAGNTTTTRKFLRQTGTGIISAIPAWDTIVAADIPITNTQILVGNVIGVGASVALTLNATGGAFALANTGVLTMPNADAATRGLLLAADWTTFNSKQSALTFPLSGALGGTGVANTGFTITLAGNLVTTGAFNTTIAAVATGTYTLPASTSTLASLTLAETFATGVKTFNNNIIAIRNPANTFSYTITSAAIAANRVLTLPLITATDTLVTLGLAQTFTAAKTFNNNTLLFRNPANTFSYTITADAIVANRTLNLPLITATDTLATLGLAQTFSAAITLGALAGFGSGIVAVSNTGLLSWTASTSPPIYPINEIVFGDGATAGGITNANFVFDVSTGFFGIGTTTAACKLDVNFASSGVSNFRVIRAYDTSSAQPLLNARYWNDGTDTAGFFDIRSPVAGNAALFAAYDAPDGSGAYLAFGVNSNVANTNVTGFTNSTFVDSNNNGTSNLDLAFKIGGVDALRISQATRYIGIGTSTPSTLLHLGEAGTLKGVLGMAGDTSGLVTIQPKSAAGSWTLTLPDSGSPIGFLKNSGSGVTEWKSPLTALFDRYTDQNNTSTTESDLYSDTLAAGQLASSGDKVIAQYQLICSGAALSTQTIRIYFGGTKIYDSGALAIGAITSNFTFNVTVICVSSSVVRCAISVSSDFATLFPYSKYTEVTGLTLSNTQVIKITGQASGAGAASNQITAKQGYVSFLGIV